MVSFTDAVQTNFLKTLEDGTCVYSGTLDPLFTVAAVPHGGYLLGIILEAVMHSQSTTNQPDPIHVSAHYLLPSRADVYEVRLKPQRIGKRFSNITADLYQNGQMNITTHIIVGTLEDPARLSKDKSMPTILPPHPYAARIPFRTHTAVSKPSRVPEKLTFHKNVIISNDLDVRQRFLKKSEDIENSNGGIDDATWYELLNEKPGQRLGLSAMAFLADLCRNTPAVLPMPDHPGPSWFPTMSFQLEFRIKLSALPDYIEPHTFGVWSTGRFITQGRHDVASEVWTAPSKIGAGGTVDPAWREKMFCIVRSTQMALTIPLEVNARKAKTKPEKRIGFKL